MIRDWGVQKCFLANNITLSTVAIKSLELYLATRMNFFASKSVNVAQTALF